ncbi:hypothetical protein AWH62_09195 [Maricaulis sp. W15]|uniref:hypothetical protein n=1 Tax=Maricaulis sp. W15 TaxID=1772333 RepID=UPI000949084A|nr:hypothetical protein [Maricaulis sp. W15]OLF73110.1 hypothetical protein AWH62_09195 [Maricaulis sp. W15]
MTDELATARADLAFLRTLAEGDPRPSPGAGLLLMSAGLLYGLETLIHWVGISDLVALPGWVHLTAAVGATGGFMLALVIILWMDRKQPTGTAMRKAYETAFQAAGLANLAMVFVFGFNAFKTENFALWLYYIPVVFALQGAAWFVAARVQKRLWYGVVAIGWYLAAAALGLTMGSPGLFNLVTSVALFGLMAVPGFVMWRLSRAAD